MKLSWFFLFFYTYVVKLLKEDFIFFEIYPHFTEMFLKEQKIEKVQLFLHT